MKLRNLIAGLLIGVAAIAADSGAELFSKANLQEKAAGNLEDAIKLYQRVATEFASDHALAAKALMAEARCYENLVQDKAVKLYEQVAHDYPDQHDQAAAANARLAVLRQGERAAAPVTMTQHKIGIQDATGLTSNSSDGQRVFFKDTATGALMMSDVGGNRKRVIFTPKDSVLDNFNISRDFSLVLMRLTKSDKSSSYAVVGADGRGFHEIAGDSGAGAACGGKWSWDNRSVLFCQRQPEGPTQVVRVSLADGQIHRVHEKDGVNYRLSPDGRFVSYNSPEGATYIVAAGGGDPNKLAIESFFPWDWTHDGRYLIGTKIDGNTALYLLPIKDGRQDGDPIFVRDGDFLSGGQTTASGAYVYPTRPQSGAYTPWIGKLDTVKNSVGWKKLNLASSNSGGGALSSVSATTHSPTWSPDSTQIAYLASSGPSGQLGSSALRLYDIASGKERELRRDVWHCWWSAPPANIICTELGEKSEIQVLSISAETGHAEPLGAVPEALSGGTPVLVASDGRAIYLRSSKLGLVRWEIGTPTWTTVDESPGYTLFPSPDERWIARRKNSRVEIRPMSGGDWRPVAPDREMLNENFTSDGNWLVYYGRDAVGKFGLFRVATSGGRPERLGDYPNTGKDTGDIWLSPDGQTFFADTGNSNELWMLENFEPKQEAAKSAVSSKATQPK